MSQVTKAPQGSQKGIACSVPGCDKLRCARGVCDTHYYKLRKSGEIQLLPTDPATRFQSYIDRSGKCWLWRGPLMNKGYGQFRAGGKTVLAHRYSYEMHRGAIAPGMQVDHLCLNKACVNPWHMEIVTLVENSMRSDNITALNARKTHCKYGHELSGRNLLRTSRGGRDCRKCHIRRNTISTRKSRARAKQSRSAETQHPPSL